MKTRPSFDRRAFLKATVLSPLAARLGVSADFMPDRHWRVFILNDSHLDIGWHALPDVIRERIAGYIDEAVGLCEATKVQPEEESYQFTIEHSWVVEYYEQHRKPEQFSRLVDCIRRGQIEVGALYTSVHTDLCGHEELVRLTAVSGEIRRRLNLPIHTALLNDVGESYTMGLAQVLARSGVPYLCLGPGAKANVQGIVPRLPRLFHWVAKDGSSVLVAWTPGIWTYARWSEAGYHGNKTLEEFQGLPDYPYDVIFRHGGKGDISSPDPKMSELIAKYRSESPQAQIRLATAAEFFNALSQQFKNEIPSVSGDAADSWADGVVSLAHETAIHRRTQAELIRAEILMTLAGLDMRREIRDAYSNLQLYADHTWGFDFDPDNRPGEIRHFTRDLGGGQQRVVEVPPGDTLEPGSPLMQEYEESWEAKKQYAYRAQKTSTRVLERSLQALNPANTVAVWNTLSWPRSGIASFDVPNGIKIKRVRAREGGDWMPVQRDTWNGRQRYLFLAKDVPAFGCQWYEIEAGLPEEPKSETGLTISTELHRVELSSEAAAIRSILDRVRNTRLNDGSAPYSIGQYIYADVNNFYIGGGKGGQNKSGYAFGPGNRSVPEPDGEPIVTRGAVLTSLAWNSKLASVPGAARLRNRVVLWDGLPQISFDCLTKKKATPRKEQIYIAFPFDVGSSPKFSLELAYTALDWEKDILPGSWRGYGCIRNYVRVVGQGGGVTWSSLDAPLVCVGGIHSNEWDPHWHDTYAPSNGHLYSYVMSNVWNCNYPLYQGGEARFEYAFRNHDREFSQAQSFRFGWEMQHPLEARWCGAVGGKAVRPAFGCEVEPANVAVTVLKPADTGNSYVLRLFETEGKSNTLASLRILGQKFTSARILNLVEDEGEPAMFRNNCLELQLRPYETATVKLSH